MKVKKRIQLLFIGISILLLIAIFLSLAVGRYSIVWQDILKPGMSQKVFLTLRLPRTGMVLLAGIGLGVAGSAYQMVFQNPLASPDVIGISSGASVGAAIAILYLETGISVVALSSFIGGVVAVFVALALSSVTRDKGVASIVLSGIVVNSLTQAVLMLLKLTADPEKELAAIEFWTMGSFADITVSKFMGVLPWVLIGLIGLLFFHRHLLLLGLNEDDATMLGVPVIWARWGILLMATLITGSIVSVAGLIAFAGLLAPHIARLMMQSNRFSTVIMSGFVGGCLLLYSDVIARIAGSGEIPISIVTSLIGAPFLCWFLWKSGNRL